MLKELVALTAKQGAVRVLTLMLAPTLSPTPPQAPC